MPLDSPTIGLQSARDLSPTANLRSSVWTTADNRRCYQTTTRSSQPYTFDAVFTAPQFVNRSLNSQSHKSLSELLSSTCIDLRWLSRIEDCARRLSDTVGSRRASLGQHRCDWSAWGRMNINQGVYFRRLYKRESQSWRSSTRSLVGCVCAVVVLSTNTNRPLCFTARLLAFADSRCIWFFPYCPISRCRQMINRLHLRRTHVMRTVRYT